MSRMRSSVHRPRRGIIVSSAIRLLAAQKVLDQLEPLHCDDKAMGKALKDANREATIHAKKALEKWIRG